MESTPPPPPPPPALEMTTIGKYIARFRYEKPQPRESRVAAQRSDFWWTASPRYSRSPSPPSTWASGGVFSFPDSNELDEELADEGCTKEEEREANIAAAEEEDDDRESVDSVESKLRRRLGVWDSDSRERMSDKREELSAAKSPQSWGSAEWGSVDLEEEAAEEEEEEDPEQVIRRVRRRLGWGAATLGTRPSVSRLKPVEFRLLIDGDADKRETTQGQLRMKPPLSPGSFESGEAVSSFGCRSDLSWGSLERERGYDDKRVEEVASSSSSVDAKDGRVQVSAVEGKEKEDLVVESEEEMAVRRGSGSSAGGIDTSQSVHDGLASTDFIATELRSSGSSGGLHCAQGSEPREESNDALTAPMRESFEDVPSTTPSPLHTSESNVAVEEKEEESQSQYKSQEHDAADRVSELPLLPTASPARPEPTLELSSPSSNGNLSGHSHGLRSSSHRNEELVPGQTTKTLDSLVSLVVHSWENDFFSESGSEQKETGRIDNKPEHDAGAIQDSNDAGDTYSATNAPKSPNVSLPTTSENSGESKESVSNVQDLMTTVPSTKELSQATVPAETISTSSEEIALLEQESEEKEDSEVPGEEDDQIAQMLLERIALLEEALHQIDS